MSNPIVLGYWDLHGLASSIRYLLELVEANYTEDIFTYDTKDDWFENKKKNLGLLYPNIPYLIDGDVKLTEHVPILRYLARKFNLYPKTEQELVVSDQTESFISDIRWTLIRACYDNKTYNETRAAAIEQVRTKLPHLNNLLSKNEYVLGSKLTYVDIIVYDVLLLVRAFEPSLLNENANLIRFVDKITSLPNITKYISSKRFKDTKGNPRTFCAAQASFKGTL